MDDHQNMNQQSPPGAPPETPPGPPPNQPPSGNVSPNRTIMVILSYLGILAIIPLLVEQDDAEVQWHAKHGIVLLVSWIVISIALSILAILPVIGTIFGCAGIWLLWLVALGVHIMCIIKALNGERFRVPFVTDFADQWK
jgi:uncharacterized membrane protein